MSRFCLFTAVHVRIRNILFHDRLVSRPQISRYLGRGSAASRLLGLRVRIAQGTWISVSYECCALSGKGLCVRLITCPEDCGMSEYNEEASIKRRLGPSRGCCAMELGGS